MTAFNAIALMVTQASFVSAECTLLLDSAKLAGESFFRRQINSDRSWLGGRDDPAHPLLDVMQPCWRRDRVPLGYHRIDALPKE